MTQLRKKIANRTTMQLVVLKLQKNGMHGMHMQIPKSPLMGLLWYSTHRQIGIIRDLRFDF